MMMAMIFVEWVLCFGGSFAFVVVAAQTSSHLDGLGGGGAQDPVCASVCLSMLKEAVIYWRLSSTHIHNKMLALLQDRCSAFPARPRYSLTCPSPLTQSLVFLSFEMNTHK